MPGELGGRPGGKSRWVSCSGPMAPDTRATAAAALGDQGHRGTRTAPRRRDRETRTPRRQALGEIEDHRATGALADGLARQGRQRSPSGWRRPWGKWKIRRPQGDLARAIDDGDMVVRRLAQSLGELDNLKRAPARLVAAERYRPRAQGHRGDVAERDRRLRRGTGVEDAGADAFPAMRSSRTPAETDDGRGVRRRCLAAKDKDQAIRHTAAEALKDRHDDDDDE